MPTFFTGKTGDSEVLKAQIAKDLRIARLRQVREQSRHRSVTQSVKYREHIDGMKDAKRAELEFSKQTEHMQRRKFIEESYKHALIDTGLAHRLAEDARKKSNADARVQVRKTVRQRQMSEHRFSEAIEIRQEVIAREERRLEVLRDNLRMRHDIGAHNREDANAVAAMKQARQAQLQQSRKTNINYESGYMTSIDVAMQTDVDVTKRSNMVKIQARVVRHGSKSAEVVSNQAVAVKIDNMGIMRKKVIKEMQTKWRQEIRAEAAKEKRVEKKRNDTFAVSLAVLDRLDRSPQRLDRIRTVADVKRADRRLLEMPDSDALLSQFENMFFNPQMAHIVDMELEGRHRSAAGALSSRSKKWSGDTSDESSTPSSPSSSFDGRRKSERSQNASVGSNASNCSDGAGPENDSSTDSICGESAESERNLPRPVAKFNGMKCQKFATGDLAVPNTTFSSSDHLGNALEPETDCDESALDQSMYSQNAMHLPYMDEADMTSEQDNTINRNMTEVSTWTRVHHDSSRKKKNQDGYLRGSGEGKPGQSFDQQTFPGCAPFEVTGWTPSDSVFATKLPVEVPVEILAALSDHEGEQDTDYGLFDEEMFAVNMKTRLETDSDGEDDINQSSPLNATNRQDFVNVRASNQSYASDADVGGTEGNDYQLFFENEDYAELDLASKIVTSPDIKPPPPPAVKASAQRWFVDALSDIGNEAASISDHAPATAPASPPEHVTVGNIGIVVVKATPRSPMRGDGGNGAAMPTTVVIADVNIPHPLLPLEQSPTSFSDATSSTPSSSSLDSGSRLGLDINRPFNDEQEEEYREKDTSGLVSTDTDEDEDEEITPPADSSDDSMRIDPQLYEQYLNSPANSAKKPATVESSLPPLTLSTTPDTSQDLFAFSGEHNVDDSWREEQARLSKARHGTRGGLEDLEGSDLSRDGDVSLASTVMARHDAGKNSRNSPLARSQLGAPKVDSSATDSNIQLNAENNLSRSLITSDSAADDDGLFQISPPSYSSSRRLVPSTGGLDRFPDMNDSISSSSSSDDADSIDMCGDLEVDRTPPHVDISTSYIDEHIMFPSPSFGRTLRAAQSDSASNTYPHPIADDEFRVESDSDSSSQSSLSWSADQSKSFIIRVNRVSEEPALAAVQETGHGFTTTLHSQNVAHAYVTLDTSDAHSRNNSQLEEEETALAVTGLHDAVVPSIPEYSVTDANISPDEAKATSTTPDGYVTRNTNDSQSEEEETSPGAVMSTEDGVGGYHASTKDLRIVCRPPVSGAGSWTEVTMNETMESANQTAHENSAESNQNQRMREQVSQNVQSDLFGDESSVEESSDDTSIGLDALDNYNISLDENATREIPLNKNSASNQLNDTDDVDAKFDALLAYATTRSWSSQGSNTYSSSSSASLSISVNSESSSSAENMSGGILNRARQNQVRAVVARQQPATIPPPAVDPRRLDAGSITSDSLGASLRSSPSLSVEVSQPVLRIGEAALQRREEVGQAIATTYMRHLASTDKTVDESSLLQEAILSDDSLNAEDSEDSLSLSIPVPVANKDPNPQPIKQASSISSRYQQFQLNQYKYASPGQTAADRSSSRLYGKDKKPVQVGRLNTVAAAVPMSTSNVRQTRGSFSKSKEADELDLSDMPILQEFEDRLRKMESGLRHYDVLSTSITETSGGGQPSFQANSSATGLDDSISLNSSELSNIVYREQRLSETSPKYTVDNNRMAVTQRVSTGDVSIESMSSVLGSREGGSLENPSTESGSLQFLYYHAISSGKQQDTFGDEDATLEEIKEMLYNSNAKEDYSSLVDREVAAALAELDDSDSDPDLSLSINNIIGEVDKRALRGTDIVMNLKLRSSERIASASSVASRTTVSSSAMSSNFHEHRDFHVGHTQVTSGVAKRGVDDRMGAPHIGVPAGRGEIRQVVSAETTSGYGVTRSSNAINSHRKITSTSTSNTTRSALLTYSNTASTSSHTTTGADLTAYSLDKFMSYGKEE